MAFSTARKGIIGKARVAGLALFLLLFQSRSPALAQEKAGDAPANPLPASATGSGVAPSDNGAVMTQDLLLIGPNQGAQAKTPLQSYVSSAGLKLDVLRSDVLLLGLRGLMIAVDNETNRPLVIDGDDAKVSVGSKDYACAPITVLQKNVLPDHNVPDQAGFVVTKVVPTAATVGALPTVQDFIASRRSILSRYGLDEKRRESESSRFGKRILWPHEKTEGIVFFRTNETLKGSRIQIPVHTLFDVQDSAVITAVAS